MLVFDKDEIKNTLTNDNIFDLLVEFGGEPTITEFGFISRTICHNPLEAHASRKLYYYTNSGLFQCYTSCGMFDIFELVIKVFALQYHQDIDLNDAVRWVAYKFGISGQEEEVKGQDLLEDWKYFANYDRIEQLNTNENPQFILKEYDRSILDKFNYNCEITPWLKDNIAAEAMKRAQIGFYPGGDQITIPHFDQNGRFVGLRGRTLIKEEAELYGKYRPIKIGDLIYSHPLGMNLYNLNNSKENIAKLNKAIIFESEKSCLQYQSYFGADVDITTACCGSSVSNFQINLLLETGAKEIVIAFDRQFQEIGDDEFIHLKNNLIKIHEKYKTIVNISFIFDKKKITQYKASPTDEGADKFLKLFKERIVL